MYGVYVAPPGACDVRMRMGERICVCLYALACVCMRLVVRVSTDSRPKQVAHCVSMCACVYVRVTQPRTDHACILHSAYRDIITCVCVHILAGTCLELSVSRAM